MSYSTDLPKSTNPRRFLKYGWIIGLVPAVISLITGIIIGSRYIRQHKMCMLITNEVERQTCLDNIQILNTVFFIFLIVAGAFLLITGILGSIFDSWFNISNLNTHL